MLSAGHVCRPYWSASAAPPYRSPNPSKTAWRCSAWPIKTMAWREANRERCGGFGFGKFAGTVEFTGQRSPQDPRLPQRERARPLGPTNQWVIPSGKNVPCDLSFPRCPPDWQSKTAHTREGAQMAAHASTCTRQLYDRREDHVTLLIECHAVWSPS